MKNTFRIYKFKSLIFEMLNILLSPAISCNGFICRRGGRRNDPNTTVSKVCVRIFWHLQFPVMLSSLIMKRGEEEGPLLVYQRFVYVSLTISKNLGQWTTPV